MYTKKKKKKIQLRIYCDCCEYIWGIPSEIDLSKSLTIFENFQTVLKTIASKNLKNHRYLYQVILSNPKVLEFSKRVGLFDRSIWDGISHMLLNLYERMYILPVVNVLKMYGIYSMKPQFNCVGAIIFQGWNSACLDRMARVDEEGILYFHIVW